MRRSRLGASASLLLVFAAGVAGGVALERLWLDSRSPAAERDRRDYQPVIERFSEELELTDRQQARIDTIITDLRERMREMWAEARPRYRAMVDSAKTRIEAILDEEQVEKYRRLLEREAERHDKRWGPDSTREGTAPSDDSAADAGTAPGAADSGPGEDRP